MTRLEIKNLHVSIEGKEILKGIDLTLEDHEVHTIMGPNGSGKSTLAYTIMGHPDYEITDGTITVDGVAINELSPDERSKLGLFLSFQYPLAIPGVTVSNFLRTAMNAHQETPLSVVEANKVIAEKLQLLEMDTSFLKRYVNDGFSGGEKKRMEILQMAALQPKLAVLDETDSGTDVDALRIIAEGINKIRAKQQLGILLITHYDRILHLITPDRVSVIMEGKVVATGGADLGSKIEKEGYAQFRL